MAREKLKTSKLSSVAVPGAESLEKPKQAAALGRARAKNAAPDSISCGCDVDSRTTDRKRGATCREVALAAGTKAVKLRISHRAWGDSERIVKERGAVTPNDPKLSDCGARRGSCEGGAKKEVTDVGRRWLGVKTPGRKIAATVTRGAVRCSAWLGVSFDWNGRSQKLIWETGVSAVGA